MRIYDIRTMYIVYRHISVYNAFAQRPCLDFIGVKMVAAN